MPARRSYPQHPRDVTRSLARLLNDLGVRGAYRLCESYPLELVLESYIDICQMLDAGVQVHNPAGLMIYRLTTAPELAHPWELAPYNPE